MNTVMMADADRKRRLIGEYAPAGTPHRFKWSQPVTCDWHKVEMFDRKGRRVATLFGDESKELKARAARWEDALNIHLEMRHTRPDKAQPS